MTALKLAGEFPAADREAWAERAITALKGRPLDDLTTTTYDGIAIQPVVPRAMAPAPFPVDHRGWRTMQRMDMPDVVRANAQALEDLENGAEALCLVWPESLAAGSHGVPVTSPDQMALLFQRIHLDLITLRLDAGRMGRPAAHPLVDFYQARNIDLSRAKVSFCLDPVGAFALTGKLIETGALAQRMAETLRRLDDAGHKGDVFAADARVWHGAGASEAQELGLALATGVQYLRLLEQGGLGPETTFSRLSLVLSADADQFMTIAKCRAARLLWARLAETLGQPAAPVTVHAETSLRMMMQRDAHVNLLRTTTAAFAAGVGGADTVTVLPFTAALGLADAFARRMARNIQSILKEESGIGEVVDAAAGSGHMESLTLALAERAWEIFRGIEKGGGLIKALTSGRVHKLIDEVAAPRDLDLAQRKVGLTGLSEFADVNEKPAKTLAMDLPSDWAKGTAFEKPGGDVKTIACPALRQESTGAAFERLRDRADAIAAKSGRRPAVFLANLGSIADYSARATWMANLLAAGGIEALSEADDHDTESMARAFQASGARIACLCSSDEIYPDIANAAAVALKESGAVKVFMAGSPGEKDALVRGRAQAIDGSVYQGIDAAGFLTEVLDIIAQDAPETRR